MSALDFFEPIVAIINKVIPDKAAAQVAAVQLKAAAHTHPIAGRHPATNTEVLAASTLSTSD